MKLEFGAKDHLGALAREVGGNVAIIRAGGGVVGIRLAEQAGGMAKHQGLILGVVLLVPLVGCATSADDASVDFRSGAQGWELDVSNPGDGPMEIETGDDDTIDLIMWDLDGGNVTRETDGGLVMAVDGDGRVRSGGHNVCHAVRSEHSAGTIYKFANGSGDVKVSVWQNLVFAGDVEDPRVNHPQLAFSFVGNEIRLGDPGGDDVVAQASDVIEEASPIRRLTAGALVMGVCGSQGLP